MPCGSSTRPEPLTNSRSALAVEQVIFDGGRTRAAVRTASLAAAAAMAAERQIRNDLVLAATRAYGQVLRAGAGRRAAESAVAAAEENARTAEARRDAGTGTEADVLSMRVHLAEMRARAIDAASGERIARAELNRLMNTPLDREWILDEPAVAGARASRREHPRGAGTPAAARDRAGGPSQRRQPRDAAECAKRAAAAARRTGRL